MLYVPTEQTFTFNKKTIIKALEKEPLIAGRFFEKEYDKNCSVCAVGAVIRNSIKDVDLYTTRTANKMTNDLSICNSFGLESKLNEIDDVINQFHYLSALSMFHEHMAATSMKKVEIDDVITVFKDEESESNHRMELINFVEAYFPDEFNITVKV